MNITEIEEDVKRREQYILNLEGTLLYLQQDGNSKHVEAVNLISHELFFVKDQLGNYRILLGLLRDENDKKVPEADL